MGTFESYDKEQLSYGHLHIALSDSLGNVIGGHLMNGSIIHTTAEVTLIENHQFQFQRIWDESTGFNELRVKRTPVLKSKHECKWLKILLDKKRLYLKQLTFRFITTIQNMFMKMIFSIYENFKVAIYPKHIFSNAR
jgi:hypothetical protein